MHHDMAKSVVLTRLCNLFCSSAFSELQGFGTYTELHDLGQHSASNRNCVLCAATVWCSSKHDCAEDTSSLHHLIEMDICMLIAGTA